MGKSDETRETARVLVTGGRAPAEWLTTAALREAVPDAEITRTDFHAVYLVERPGDSEQLSRDLARQCADDVGHLTALLSRVDTESAAIRDGAVDVALEHVQKGDSFAFRINKRGARMLDRDTPELEEEIGAAIWEALERGHGEEPEVDLESPDVRVAAEVFGPKTWIGVWRQAWASSSADDQASSPGKGTSGQGRPEKD